LSALLLPLLGGGLAMLPSLPGLAPQAPLADEPFGDGALEEGAEEGAKEEELIEDGLIDSERLTPLAAAEMTLLRPGPLSWLGWKGRGSNALAPAIVFRRSGVRAVVRVAAARASAVRGRESSSSPFRSFRA
jgi:hypothetical protein